MFKKIKILDVYNADKAYYVIKVGLFTIYLADGISEPNIIKIKKSALKNMLYLGNADESPELTRLFN